MQVNVAFSRTMQERMFPIGTNLTQVNLVLFCQWWPKNRADGSQKERLCQDVRQRKTVGRAGYSSQQPISKVFFQSTARKRPISGKEGGIMSGMALIWAANVKGLKLAAKIVLIQLADFHNKEPVSAIQV